MEKFDEASKPASLKDKKTNICKLSNVCWSVLVFCIVCSSFIAFGIYMLQSMKSTKQEVESLQQEVDRLKRESTYSNQQKLPVAVSRVKRQFGSRESPPSESSRTGRRGQPRASVRAAGPRPTGVSGQQRGTSTRGPPGLQGPKGQPGRDGMDGTPGQPGRDGMDGRAGPPGEDGMIGPPGQRGAPGLIGAPGPSGQDGAPGRPGFDGTPGLPGRPGDSSSSGSTFIKWGSHQCPQVADRLYRGYAAAANPGSGRGGSTELECLNLSPSWQANSVTDINTLTKLFAAKFALGDFPGIFDEAADNSIIACAVCITSKAPTITLPGTVDCLTGWHKEYDGYLMASSPFPNEVFFSSRNYCVDKNPDYFTGHNDANGMKLTFVQAGSCFGGLVPCNQYTENHLLACAVCSKLKD
ncbi:short-chain collagen C4-like isoform X3 [Watersipora subatra]|uniref:short-chain collagen C4-like isoform X3 n=1 Tax=Watersipora subatra TaxID=2589382 RepID=UPI00355ACDEC